MNAGKAFEVDFKASIPDNVYYLRLKDGGGWSNAENTRFTPANECDCILYDQYNMFMLEFKSHKGKSIPFNCISDKQLKSLVEAIQKGVVAGFIFNFRDIEETYFVYADRINEYISGTERKSIPIDYIREVGTRVKQEKKRTRYRYAVEDMLIRVV